MTEQGSAEPAPEDRAQAEFQAQSELPAQGIVVEFWDFLCHNKKWWLAPIIIALLLIALLVVISGSGLAPFIYPI